MTSHREITVVAMKSKIKRTPSIINSVAPEEQNKLQIIISAMSVDQQKALRALGLF